MRHPRITALVATVAMLAIVGIAGPALSDRSGRQMKADLRGFDEVPAVSSTGTGNFLARLAHDESALEYTLSYEDLEGTTTTAAHIHLGQRGVSGGVSAFLCGGGGKPACPAVSGSVSGTIIAADVVGPAGQGIAAGELGELIRAMRRDVTYVNVHTDKHPSGEIRGQLK
ncbi:MAG TPA: CHRD domain-containing protein [Thermoanaerobaculia bacterium]|nr:CHRD domain-containing protein [Thermoanaerobaculia bacterium]